MNYRINSPEYKLLFSCIHHFIDSTQTIEVSDGFSEELFLKLIERHRIAPLVYKALHNHISFSDFFTRELKNQFDQNVYRSLSAKMEMLRFLKAASDSGKKVLFLKGLTLAEKYYGDITYRHTLDLDIWIDPSWVEHAFNILSNQGYVSHPNWNKIGVKQKKYFKQAFHDLAFTHKSEKHRVPVEIHWRLREGNGHFCFDPHSEWKELRILYFGNNQCKVMNDVDQFLYLCVHGSEHAWFRLKWLADLPIILSKVHFEWSFVLTRAIQLKCEKHLLVTLMLLNELLNIEIPELLKSEIKKRNYENLVQFMIEKIVSETHFNSNDKERWKTFRFLARLSGGNFTDFRYILKYLTSPLDWKILMLPDSLFFLYFPLRPFLFIYRRVFIQK